MLRKFTLPMSDKSELLSSTITPEKGTSTGTSVKQKKADNARHLLTCAGFEDETITYLFKCGYSSPERIVQNYSADLLKIIVDEDLFPYGMLGSLIYLAKYLLWYQNEHDGFYRIQKFFTSDSISRFQYQVPTMSTSSPSPMISDGPNVSAADY